eukprot:4558296-Prymnesium_polylepis.1
MRTRLCVQSGGWVQSGELGVSVARKCVACRSCEQCACVARARRAQRSTAGALQQRPSEVVPPWTSAAPCPTAAAPSPLSVCVQCVSCVAKPRWYIAKRVHGAPPHHNWV